MLSSLAMLRFSSKWGKVKSLRAGQKRGRADVQVCDDVTENGSRGDGPVHAGAYDCTSPGGGDIGLIMLIAYVLWEVSRIMIDQQIEAEGDGEQAEMGDEGGTGGSRLGTLCL